MLEIVPNWHPIFVHFTVALLSLAVALSVIVPALSSPLREQWAMVARWTLWFGTIVTIITAATGFYAYNTVAHDTPSHAAMTDHRNWAIATLLVFLVLAIWSVIRERRQQASSAVFVILLLVAGSVLAGTAWRGGEIVYRYGLGVMSLPQANGDGHAHDHGGLEGHSHESPMPDTHESIDTHMEPHDGTDHHHDGA